MSNKYHARVCKFRLELAVIESSLINIIKGGTNLCTRQKKFTCDFDGRTWTKQSYNCEQIKYRCISIDERKGTDDPRTTIPYDRQ